MMAGDIVDTIEALEALYGEPRPHSIGKEVTRLTPAYRRFIEASPFVALATVGGPHAGGGMDCTPRGDRAPVVHVVDDTTVHLPDRRGNNRIDSLRNIVADGRVALLFLVPGVAECLRINGTAVVTTSAELRARYAVDGKEPATIIVVTVGSVYFQCARAIKRAEIWNPDRHVEPADVPTAGQMIEAALALGEGDRGEIRFDATTYDRELADRQRGSRY